MGLTTMALTFKANQANEGLDPAAWDLDYWLHDQQGDLRPNDGYLLPHCRHGAHKRMGDDEEGHGETTSHKMAREPPPYQ
jgi:hypothetical protein